MALRLAALLLLGVALAAGSGQVRKAAGGAPTEPVSARLAKAPRHVSSATCPIPAARLHAFKYASRESRIPLPMLYAVARAESNLNPDARSAAGARGTMQVLPSTAAAVGAPNVDDPDQNIVAGARYLRAMLNRFADPSQGPQHQIDLALAAYNAGPTAVAAEGAAPNPVTAAYVQNVNRLWVEAERAVQAC
jgi:soluble lytic murein transglycosylase-like protein